MSDSPALPRALHCVTGALGYSGRHIAQRLLNAGESVSTLTGHPNRPDPFGGRVQIRNFLWDDPAAMRRSLADVRVLYNTYWVRFDHGESTHAQAVVRSQALFEAAATAGVERVVHVSITQPSLDSPLPYFSGKARVEEALKGSGLSYAILRPTVFFGGQDVLLNNIAWLLRRFPVFGVAGDGTCLLQPVHVEDMARIALEEGMRRENVVRDVVGPETFTFDQLVRLLASAVQRPARILHLPAGLVLAVGRLIGILTGDVVLTADEIRGLNAGLLVSPDPAPGQISLSVWLQEHAQDLGRSWASELARHYTPAA